MTSDDPGQETELSQKLILIESLDVESPDGFNALCHLLNDAFSEVRMRAVEKIGLAESADVKRLTYLLGDPDELVRVEAIEAIARNGHAVGVELFFGCLHDRSVLVRAYAIDAIRRAAKEDREIIRIVIARQLQNASGMHRASILAALHDFSDKEALKKLLTLASASDYRTACYVINTLPDLKMTVEERSHCLVLLRRVLDESPGRAVEDAARRTIEALSS